MYKIILLLLVSVSCLQSMAQCQILTEREYQSAKYRLMGNSRTINSFQGAMDLARMYCLSSTQSKELAGFLANDRDKFDFLKSAFPNVVDKENFADVMDVFRLFSSAIKLYHYTLGSSQSLTPHPNHRQILPSSNPNCHEPMDNFQFIAIKRTVDAAQNDRAKASAILSANRQCLMTNQIVDMTSSIRDENIRLDVLKRMLPLVYDPQNYASAGSILSLNLRNIFLGFLQNPNAPTLPNSNMVEMTEVDFNQFLSTVRNQSFDKDREEYIKTYMKNAYMTTRQIKQAIKLLSFDSSKLDLAKFLFDKCVDKQNYFTVAEELQFSSSKSELNDYVKSRL